MEGALIVKICGMTNEADALLAVGLGADAVGFILAPSPRQIAPSVAGDIVKRLPHDVLTVGVFRDEAPARVVEIANTVGFGAVQLHGHETAEECRWIRSRVARTIKAFPAGDRAIGRFAEFGADYLLVDGPSPGSGQVFDWRLAEGVVDPQTMFVSGGLDPRNVADAIAALRPGGVDVASGVESAPGKKDPEKLRAFVRTARAAAALAAGTGSPPRAAGHDPADESSPSDAPAPYDWMEG
ncbi:MAG TPA: phosphoribosylanthranilate isomerase [Acidimicrobiales bacterium]|nr:phosphoribosylanthranilate isomerase [Acidimicrobiales bacterium]